MIIFFAMFFPAFSSSRKVVYGSKAVEKTRIKFSEKLANKLKSIEHDRKSINPNFIPTSLNNSVFLQ